MSERDENREMKSLMNQLMSWFVRWWLLLLVLGVLGAAVVVLVNPWFTNQETRNTRNTIQYRTTRLASLRQFKTSYDALTPQIAALEDQTGDAAVQNQRELDGLRAQQRAMILQMRQECDLLPRGDVPDDIDQLLASH